MINENEVFKRVKHLREFHSECGTPKEDYIILVSGALSVRGLVENKEV